MDGLSGREFVGTYLFLKSREEELDETLRHLVARMERTLYERLSIDEFERLDELYRAGIDVFEGSA